MRSVPRRGSGGPKPMSYSRFGWGGSMSDSVRVGSGGHDPLGVGLLRYSLR